MKLEHHIAVSTVISAVLFAVFRSFGLSVASFILGIFTDLDHVIDYFIEKGFSFDREEFFSFFYKEKHKKITVIFHGWEVLIILGAAAELSNFNPWITGALIGYGQHIAIDYFYNKVPFWSYFIIWRWKKRFVSEVIFPRDRGYDP